MGGVCEKPNTWLTGAGSRRLEGTSIGHQNREAMANVGVRVEPTVRLGTEGTVLPLGVICNFHALLCCFRQPA